MEIRALHVIQTAERVPLTVELAGAGARVLAFIIDFWVMMCLLGLLLMALSIVSGQLPHLGFRLALVREGMQTIIPLILLLFFFGYHFVQEWLWQGKTVGKAVLRIRVVRNNGQPIGFWEAFGRNLLRLIDVYASGIGLFPMLISKSEKRFGDFLAGSLVIQNDAGLRRKITRPTLPPATETLDASPLSRLNVQEQEVLRDFLQRVPKLLAHERKRLDEAFRRYFRERLHYSLEESQAPLFLEDLLT